MIPLLALAGCTGEPRGLEVELHAEQTWSDPADDQEQHHATVAVVAQRAVVSWTDGPIGIRDNGSWVRRLGPQGQPDEPAIALTAAGAAKPDVIALPDGRVVAGYQANTGVYAERVDLDAGTTELAQLAPLPYAQDNPSVDLAYVEPHDSVVAVWYDPEPPLAVYRRAAVNAELRRVGSQFGALASTDHLATATPDIDADPAGVLALAWIDQAAPDGETYDHVYLDAYGDGGERLWRELVAEGGGVDTPRRPTVVSFPDGRIAVGWRVRADDRMLPSRVALAFLEADGSVLEPAFQLLDEDSDDLVIARVGDDALWATWIEVLDTDHGEGIIRGGLLSFPDGEWLAGPLRLSSSSAAARPHAAAGEQGRGRWRVVTSWEELDDDGVRRIRGRTGTVR